MPFLLSSRLFLRRACHLCLDWSVGWSCKGGHRVVTVSPHIRRLQMTKHVCYLTMLTPLIITTIPSSLDHSSSLPSHLFSPHPLWSHRNPFHFLHCRQRFFNNANLIGSLLCSKPFNSFPLSSVPCGKSTCL